MKDLILIFKIKQDDTFKVNGKASGVAVNPSQNYNVLQFLGDYLAAV